MTQEQPAFSVAALYAEREAIKRREKQAEDELHRRKEEELAAFKARLETFDLQQEQVDSFMVRVRGAFERGETELVITTFPSAFCSDDGRAVTNASRGVGDSHTADGHPVWLATMPRGVRAIYNYWDTNLRPGGFGLDARIVDYPGGMPGNVGLFLSWRRSQGDT